jgi:hypothetical protein
VKRSRAQFCIALAALAWPSIAIGQVGHPPESSPYTPLQARNVLAISGGLLGGSAGSAGVGPTDGPFLGARLDLHISGPAEVGFGLHLASLDRLVIDPTVAEVDRVIETAQQSVFLVDVGILLLLAGEKTWNRLAPYVGFSLGVALGGSVDADSLSGYTFGTHFQAAPHLGVRWYPTDRFMFRIEGRDILWRLKYPGVFFQTPANAPGDPSVLDPTVSDDTQWTHHPTIVITLGYDIRF